MPWPTPQDYNEAMQTPKSVFTDAGLRRASPETTKLGLPKAITGNFASVYRLTEGRKEWAVRCFHRQYADRRGRYARISETLAKAKLPQMVPFEYIDEGIRIRGQWHPILKMEWIRGPLLNAYVAENLSRPKVIKTLARTWRSMCAALRSNGVAHGDLQHGNIIIVKGQIRLVDYDGMFVEAMAGMRSNETGHPNYQHPLRAGVHFGPYIDNFSAWVIYVSLVALADDPSLWEQTTRGDEALLFKKKDFEFPSQSRVFKLLSISANPKVRDLVARFEDVVRHPVSQTPSLDGRPPTVFPMVAVAPPPAGAVPAPARSSASPSSPPSSSPSTPPASAAGKPAKSSARSRKARSTSTSRRTGKSPAGPWYAQAGTGSARSSSVSAPAPPPQRPAPPPPPPKAAGASRRGQGPQAAGPAPSGGPALAGAPPVSASRPGAAKHGILGGVWWVARALAWLVFTVAKWLLIGLWWLVKLLARGFGLFARTFFWRIPRWECAKLAESYRKLPPARRKRALVASALIMLALPAVGYFWYDRLADVAASVVGIFTPGRSADRAEEKEEIEFVASRRSSLYIDGKLVP
ncbi:MAG: protein kinase family protein, partial [Planctomycetota bacterium]